MQAQKMTKNEFWIWYSCRFANKTAGFKKVGLQHMWQMKQVKICANSLAIIFVKRWGSLKEFVKDKLHTLYVISGTKLSSVHFKDRLETEISEFWKIIADNSNKSDATIFQFIILRFTYRSTCFGRFSCPSSGAQWLQWQPLVLPSYRGDSCAVFIVGPAGRPTTNTARLSPRYEGKTRGCHCSHRASDDGRENARNTLNCKQTSG